ncbi:facilitated trehalose transporter Tret1-like [Anopheles nili]|uniref:facilitated trehalose transporter Tret1-like n=1 Tax=Anopheles nili TaxID=185578 RepID=UPI00237B2394|nr:facilitated trehalose transporter Tret1-like [Anopheles nili]
MVKLPYYFPNQNQCIAALAASYGALVIGMVFGWSAPTGPRMLAEFQRNFTINSNQFSWSIACMPIGGALVAIPCGIMLRAEGRKNTILFFVIPLLMGWVLLTWAQAAVMMYIGRFLQGLTVGAYLTSVPIYIGEIADKQSRGTTSCLFQIMLNLGMLMSFSISAGVNVFQLNIISGFILLLFGPIFMLMPETPLYLLKRGHKTKAIEVLKWLRGPKGNVSIEMELLQAQVDALANYPIRTLKTFLHMAKTKRPLVTIAGLMIFQQMTGISAVLFYTTNIFMKSSVSMNHEVATIIVGAMQVTGALGAAFVIDIVGRRWLLMISAVIMALSHVALGVYFELLHNGSAAHVENLEWLPVLGLSVFVALFSVGFGSVPSIMISEMFAIEVKDFAGSLASVVSCTLSVLTTQTFIPMQNGLGEAGTFWLFAGFCMLSTIFVFLFVPETRGKTVDQVQQQLVNKKAYFWLEK